MVRWVFRPYTQIRRAICTLASRRTSTRVSPGFILPKYSSPSFGSSSIYSNFEILKRVHKCPIYSIKSLLHTEKDSRVDNHLFHFRSGSECLFALILAYKWDSLVRVSRRVNLIVSEKLHEIINKFIIHSCVISIHVLFHFNWISQKRAQKMCAFLWSLQSRFKST